MKISKKVVSVIIAPFIVTMAVSCAQTRYSGFLSDYSGFKEGPSGGADLLYMKEGVDFSKYNKIMMDQVVFYFSEDSENKGIQPEVMKELADEFHKTFAEVVGADYPFTETPGSDVVRIRTAITDIKQSHPGIGVVTTIVPQALVISTIKKAATGKHTGVGSASMEVEFLDSMSNERIAAAIDTRSGGKLAGWSKYGAVKEAFKFWAERLKKRLDKLHSREG
ncbi:MAG: putative lipoprotein [Candidatus Jettenia ecosi]|uniref:Putative lipoprotein n=1 Tax=Candidatus Jettenia ecosi TaxID=2494326 RepID=A0A533QFP1_9BACT|nr:MAG: putative lipoprotein [Candidatus Jettenia ecosi]